MNRQTILIISGASVASFAAGVFGGFLYAKRTLVAGYTEILEAELEEMRNHYDKRYKVNGYETPQETARRLGVPVAPQPDDGPVEVFDSVVKDLGAALIAEQAQNIFDKPEQPTEEQIAEDVAARSVDHPYIISEEEYLENETDYRQIVLTYYEGDGVLADEADQTIDEVETYVGKELLTRFGYRSSGPTLLYVRNDHFSLDFEIVKSTGKYSVEVLGYDENTDPRQRFATKGA